MKRGRLSKRPVGKSQRLYRSQVGSKPGQESESMNTTILTSRRHPGLLVVADAVLLSLLMYGTNFVRFGIDWPAELGLFVVSFTIATATTLLTLYFGGLYEREAHLGSQGFTGPTFRLMLISGGWVALVTLASSGFARQLGILDGLGLPFPFINLVAFIVLGTFGLILLRVIVQRIRRLAEGKPRVLLVGDPTDVLPAQQQFASRAFDFEVVDSAMDGDSLGRALARGDVTDVLVLSPQWLEEKLESVLYKLDEEGVNVLLRVRGVDTMLGLREISQVSGLPFIKLRPSALPRPSAHLKRIIDLGLVVVSSPLWGSALGLLVIYQLLFVGRPIFYLQERVGLGDKTFNMMKFRSMYLEAEARSGPVLSGANDARVIPACRWMRATRMDELPQILNVLAGDMSLVGPRPERPEIIAEFDGGIDGYGRRHSIRPGLTGLAQVYGRYDTRPEYKLGYDLHYAVNWSPLLDAEIIVRTLGVVLLRRV